MSSLKESWLQDVAASNRIGALRPAVVKSLLPQLEINLRSLIEQAHKFTRRGKGTRMTVDDLNQALSQVGAEPLYGLISGEGGELADLLHYTPVVSLLDIAKQPLPACPLQPELTMHWLAVDGSQPLVPENPRLLASAEQQAQLQLPKEMRQFYYRVTSILLSADVEDRTCRAVLAALRSDSGLQELLPHLSQFVLREVKAHTRSLRVLRALMAAVDALWSNPALAVEFHLQQMLPAAFTCVIASRLSATPYEDHWALRAQTAAIIARVLRKFRSLFPDLQARVCRTYLDALDDDKALSTTCGGVLGLAALGPAVVRALLLPRAEALVARLDATRAANTTSSASMLAVDRVLQALVHAAGTYFGERRRLGAGGPWGDGNGDGEEEDAAGAAEAEQGKAQHVKQEPAAKRRKTVTAESVSPVSEAAASGLEELLVPYYAVAAPHAEQCRLFI